MTALLHHTTLEIAPAEVKACRAFYIDVLGLTEVQSPVKDTIWYAEGIHLYWGSNKRPHRGYVPASHVALVVGSRYEEVLEECAKMKLFLSFGSLYWGSPRAYICDPAGNRIEIMEYAP